MKLAEERFMELLIRSSILKEMKMKMDEELKNKGIQLLAKMMDETFENKQIAIFKVIDRWEKEINESLERLSDNVFDDFMKDYRDELHNRIKEDKTQSE